MEKLLVLGADRVIGAHVAECLADRFAEVAAMERVEQISPAALRELVLRHGPEWTVYCGACSASSWDEVTAADLAGEPERAVAVAQAVESVGGRLTVASTDAVFSGPALFHAEDAPTCGGTPLADAALALEAALEATGALVVRTHAFGREPVDLGGGYVHRAAAALAEGLPLTADARCYASPIFAGDLAELLWSTYEGGLRGLYHIAGSERISQRRFMLDLAAALGVEPHFNAVVRAGLVEAAPRLETSLICRRAQAALSQPMPFLRDGVATFAALWDEQAEIAGTVNRQVRAAA